MRAAEPDIIAGRRYVVAQPAAMFRPGDVVVAKRPRRGDRWTFQDTGRGLRGALAPRDVRPADGAR